MKHLPGYLKLASRPVDPAALNSGMEVYQPLLAVWLIDISQGLGWLEQPPRSGLEGAFGNSAFIEVTGLTDLAQLFSGIMLHDELAAMPDVEVAPGQGPDTIPEALYMRYLAKRTSAAKPTENELRATPALQRRMIKAMLADSRTRWRRRGLRSALPLFHNIERLDQLVSLNDVEKGILAFAAALAEFPRFRRALSPSRIACNDAGMIRALSLATGYDEHIVQAALRRDGALRASGLIEIDHDDEPLARKLILLRELRGVILNPLAQDEELSQQILHAAHKGRLTLHDFPHLRKDTELLTRYLQGGQEHRSEGLNILLYGPPGTGKTEYAKALIHALDWRLFEIAHADSDGEPLGPRQRLQSLVFSQRALHERPQTALLFDEVEDVFPGAGKGGIAELMGLRGRDSASSLNAKAWVNRALEDNHVPTIWITNNAQIDPAYLRRFDYSLEMNIPPHAVRRQIVHRLIGRQVADTASLDALAGHEDLLPAQIERAAKVVRLANLPSERERWAGIVQTLERSRALLGQKRRPIVASDALPYRLDYLNADTDLESLAEGLRQTGRGSLCLYGPPGTGKSAYGHWLAESLDKPLLERRVSDLMSKWVGENEQNIARAFAEAEQEGAVLLLDEVDSFLQDRRTARARWEATLVNEMLTQMESYRGIFIASTNLMDELDQASLRRFDIKIRFDWLAPEQRVALLHDYCRWLHLETPDTTAEQSIRRLHNLAPGDFASVCRQHQLRRLRSAHELVEALHAESALKQDGQGSTIGFLKEWG